MKVGAHDRQHSTDVFRGRKNPKRAASHGLVEVTDGTTIVRPVQEILFVGARVEEADDDNRARVIIGASTPGGGGTDPGGGDPGGGSGGGGTASAPIILFNNSGVDLPKGAVVVLDETRDNSVTTTTEVGDTRLVFVTAAVIPTITSGPCVLNGYVAEVLITGDYERGNWLRTSATPMYAEATEERVSGSFANISAAPNIEALATDSAATAAVTPVTSLAVTMPDTVLDGTATGRLLFLAIWRDESITSNPTVTGWTRIGATSGFWYYYKICGGVESLTITWTGASTAVAAVLVLDQRVAVSDPVEDFDYDSTSGAAGLTGLSAFARYAIAGVAANVDEPGDDFVKLEGGGAEFEPTADVELVQSTAITISAGVIYATLGTDPTVGNLVVGFAFGGNGNEAYTTDSRDPGSCPIDSHSAIHISAFTRNNGTGEDGNNVVGIQAYNTADGYPGPFGDIRNCGTPAYHGMMVAEFSGVSTVDAESIGTTTTHTGSTVTPGTFAGPVGSDDLIVMAVVWKSTDGNNGYDPGIATDPNGFTTLLDGYVFHSGTWGWIGYKVGDGDCSISAPNQYGNQYWAATAIRFPGGGLEAAGSLAGKYIGTADAVDSPFSGLGLEDDAIFALNLQIAPQASAILYGPDLLGFADAGGGGDAEFLWRPLMAFLDGSWQTVVDEGTGQAIMVFGPA